MQRLSSVCDFCPGFFSFPGFQGNLYTDISIVLKKYTSQITAQVAIISTHYQLWRTIFFSRNFEIGSIHWNWRNSLCHNFFPRDHYYNDALNLFLYSLIYFVYHLFKSWKIWPVCWIRSPTFTHQTCYLKIGI